MLFGTIGYKGLKVKRLLDSTLKGGCHSLMSLHVYSAQVCPRVPFPLSNIMYEPVTSLLTVDSHCFNNRKVRQNMYMYRFVV